MSTKKQRLAQRTAGGEPSLSLPAFAAAMPASALPSAGACASVPDCYLVYCYLCRTGACGDVAAPSRSHVLRLPRRAAQAYGAR